MKLLGKDESKNGEEKSDKRKKRQRANQQTDFTQDETLREEFTEVSDIGDPKAIGRADS